MASEEHVHAGGAAFVGEHGDDLLGGVIAEELAGRLFVIRDAVLLDKRDEV